MARGQKFLLLLGLAKGILTLYDSVILAGEEARLHRDRTAAGAGRGIGTPSLEDLGREIARLRRALLKHGHAQELFQERVEEAVDRLATGGGGSPEGRRSEEAAGRRGTLDPAQVRTLIELAGAAHRLKDLAAGGPPAEAGDRDAPRSVREGLDLLGIRVSNLQRSFGLEPIPALGRPFDDRLHRAHGVCRRPDLPEGQVVEELLPGYLLDGEVQRPALVIVNRLASAGGPDDGRPGGAQ